MSESEEELKSLLMKVKEESEKAALMLNIKKTKIMAFGRITWWQIDMEKVQGNQTCRSKRKSTLNILWKDWCWNWNSKSLNTWWEELTHWKNHWCWERLRAGEGVTEDEMVGWHHQVNACESEQSERQWKAEEPVEQWGHQESHMT